MLARLNINERRLRQCMGTLYKSLILVTLVSLFAFAPLKGQRQIANHRLTSIHEIPEMGGPSKVLWLDSKRVVRGQGDSFRLAYEE